jgi:hypothetical protein
MLFLDGAYTFGGRGGAFHRARRPSNAELGQLLDTLSRHVVRLLERRGLLIADPECPALDFEAGSSLDQLQAASVVVWKASTIAADVPTGTLTSFPCRLRS